MTKQEGLGNSDEQVKSTEQEAVDKGWQEIANLDNPKSQESQEDGFKPSQELESAEDLKEVTSWFQKEVDEHLDRTEYMMGYSYEDLIENVVKYLGEKTGKTVNKVDVKTRERTSDEITHGTVYLGGKDILDYSARDDGSVPGIDDWNVKNLQEALKTIIG